MIVPPKEDDCIAWVTVRLHSTGAISTQGTIVDKAMALHLLDQARDAIKRQVPDSRVIIPGRDVDVAPSLPTRDVGDMAPNERGDA